MVLALPGGGPVLGPGTLATVSQKSEARLTKIYNKKTSNTPVIEGVNNYVIYLYVI